LRERLAQDLTMETVRSGIERQGPVVYLSGWVPTADAQRLKAVARSRAWGLLVGDPGPEDSPPTKVLRNPVVRMIAPVFQFLGTIPGYREYDISAWFLGFFSLYFAMIFGDGGYGIILLLAGIVGTVKAKASRRRLPDALRLLLLLAVCTMGWGLVTATWFAIPRESLPGFLRAAAIPAIRGDNPDSRVNIMVFCFSLGLAQLSVAHIKNILRDFPSLKFLAQLGSLSMVVGMFTVVLNLIIDPKRFPIPTWALLLIGGGFLLVFVFGNWNGNLLRTLVAALQGFIPTFLGTVGVFADIASYMRLWAVGLAGVYISQTVNGMAAGLFGDPGGHILAFVVGALAGGVLILAGHSLNLIMTALSVVVHGIRLNMLEFSGHLGMEWSGYPYEPFRTTVPDKQDPRGKETS
jgi:V/A-type H+-transporting ATPase subunit I